MNEMNDSESRNVDLKVKIATEIKKLLELNEMERDFDAYYMLVDLMERRVKECEIERMTKLYSENQGDINIAVKLGIIRRKSSQNLKKENPEEMFREAISINRYHVHVLYNSGVVYLDYEEEKEKLDRVIEDMKNYHPNAPHTLFILAYKMGHSNLGREKEAIQMIDRNYNLIQKSRSAHRYSLVLKADMYKKLEDNERRFETMEKLFEIYPDQPWGLNEYGFHFIRKSKGNEYLDEAKQYFERSGLLYPLSTGWCYGLARVYHWEKNGDKEIEYYTKEIGLDPECQKSLKKRLELYLERNENSLALKDADRLIELSPSVENHILKSKVIVAWRGAMEAINFLEGVLDMFKDDKKICELFCELARDYGLMENYEEGVTCVTRAIKAGPDFLYSYLMRAGCNANIGKLKESVEDYNFVINHPTIKYDDIEDVYYWKGMVLSRSKYHLGHILVDDPTESENLEAIKSLQKVLVLEDYEERIGRKFESICAISKCYERLGRFGDAYCLNLKALEEIDINREKLKKDEAFEYFEEMEERCKKKNKKFLSLYGIERLLRRKNWNLGVNDRNDRLSYLCDTDGKFSASFWDCGSDESNDSQVNGLVVRKCVVYYKFLRVLEII